MFKAFKNNLHFFIMFVILIATYGYVEQLQILKEIQGFIFIKAPWYKSLIYGLYYLSCIIVLTGLLLCKDKKWISVIFLIYITLCIFFELTYINITGTLIGFEEAAIIQNNLGTSMELDVLNTYKPEIANAAIIALLFFISFYIYLSKIPANCRYQYFIFGFVFMSVFAVALQYFTTGFRIAYALPIRLPALFAYNLMIKPYNGNRKEVSIIRKDTLTYDHIVWVIDESMRGDLMQINGYHKKNLPYLNENMGKLINLGTISSVSVCSDYSNIALISGLRNHEIPDRDFLSRKHTSIFQYAKKAGYFTSFIYPIGFRNKPKGYMTPFDDASFDKKVLIQDVNSAVQHTYLDVASLNHLSDIIHTQEKTFTYLIKYGAHFHYESSYPDSMRIFTPIQEKTDYERKDKTKLLNSYLNAMYWGVDVFFKKMFDQLKDKNVLIIYTSDHGQNILDDPNTDLTHCAKGEVNHVMASVPLFITATNQVYIDNLRLKIPEINKNRGSHFELFPTLLHMMHYDSQSIKTRYGHSLFDTLAIKERNFYSGDLFGRGNFFKNKMPPPQK